MILGSIGILDSMPINQELPLLLDLYPNAKIAYSLRKLNSLYTGNAIRVRRSIDNSEQDIGFIGNNLDILSLISFVGLTGTGSIKTWYDQSGNGNNSTQTTLASQAQIMSSGNLRVDPNTGKISSLFTSDHYILNNPIPMTQLNTQVSVFNRNSSGVRIINFGTFTGTLYLGYWDSTNQIFTYYGNNLIENSTNPSSGCYIQTLLRDDTNTVKIWLNNTPLSGGIDSSVSTPISAWGRAGTSPTSSNGFKQEIIYWESNQELNRIGIETNINSYWGVY